MQLQRVDEQRTTPVGEDACAPRRILVAFDGSDGAWAALHQAIEIAVRERALLTIAAVVPEPSPWIGMGLVSLPYSRDGLRRDAQRAMEQALAAARDEVPATVSVTTRLLSGRPSRVLGRLVEAGGFDLALGPHAKLARPRGTLGVMRPTPINALRYGLPIACIIAGFVILFTTDGSLRWDGWAMCVGAGLSIAFMNVLFRMGAKGDRERDDEEAARRYLGEHGHWPDERPR